MTICYYCGSGNATLPLKISDSFTANSVVKCPHSSLMCSKCYALMFGDRSRCLFWNEAKIDKQTNAKAPSWSLMFTRNTSWLLSSTTSFPTFSEDPRTVEINGKSVTALVMANLPTRSLIRQWLLEPPEPPFTIAIAKSGQKHILFLAQQGLSRDYFPVQFETDTLHCDRAHFTQLLIVCEALMELGFNKTEIGTGSYYPSRLLKCFDQWEPLEAIVQRERTPANPTRLLQLACYVAQKSFNPDLS